MAQRRAYATAQTPSTNCHKLLARRTGCLQDVGCSSRAGPGSATKGHCAINAVWNEDAAADHPRPAARARTTDFVDHPA
eukprot:13759841-Alexandrium_andersonii.AAC.1